MRIEEAKYLHCFAVFIKIVVRPKDRGAVQGYVHKNINSIEYKDIFAKVSL